MTQLCESEIGRLLQGIRGTKVEIKTIKATLEHLSLYGWKFDEPVESPQMQNFQSRGIFFGPDSSTTNSSFS